MQDRRWSALIKPTPVKDVERRADPELSVTISDLMPPVEQGWMIAANRPDSWFLSRIRGRKSE
jgi:hypothetical protein